MTFHSAKGLLLDVLNTAVKFSSAVIQPLVAQGKTL